MLRKEDFEPNMETEDKIPGAQPENPAQSQRFGDFIVKYMQNVQNTMELFPGTSFQAINEIFGVLYVPLENMGELEVTGTSYNSIPKCYTYMDMEATGASGITRLHDHPYLKLRGKGTAVAVIDSGIDYQNAVFRNAGGSRIAYLWDQSLEDEEGMGKDKEQNESGRELESENGDVGNLLENGADMADTEVPYGKLFRKKDIDLALASENPFSIVPSRDTNGHGTALSGIAAGNMVPGENFTGAAPEATLIIIKVKPAKQYLRNFYLYPPDAEVFQENDVMMAIAYAISWAKKLEMPLSICLGMKQPGRSSGDQCIKPVCGLCGEFFPGICVSSCRKRRKYKKPQYGNFFSGKGADRDRTPCSGKRAGVYHGILGRAAGDLRAFHPVTYWGDTGSQQFYWFKDSGTVLCFCRNEGVCELYPDRAPDRIFAGIYPIFSSRLRNLEDFYPGKEQTERTVPYVASGRRIDIPGYLFSGTIALYNRDSSGGRQKQHHDNRLPAP